LKQKTAYRRRILTAPVPSPRRRKIRITRSKVSVPVAGRFVTNPSGGVVVALPGVVVALPGVVVAVPGEVDEVVVAALATQASLMILFESRVTAPFRASNCPLMVARVLAVMLVKA
jgi:hypothetical protein